jgi:ABC-type Na+ efflux pump permease subunit
MGMKNMNVANQNVSLVRLAVLVAVSAAVLLSVNVVLTASVVFGAGMLALLLGDYAREIKPVQAAPAPVVPLRPELKLAA